MAIVARRVCLRALTKAFPPVDRQGEAITFVKGSTEMREIRCGKCNKKLGAGVYLQLEIKCPRCGVINHFNGEGQEPRNQSAIRAPEVRRYGNANHPVDRWQASPGR